MMGECFVRPLVVGGTALVADADVVDGLLGGNGHREFGLEQGVGRLPVNVGHDIDTLVVPAVGQRIYCTSRESPYRRSTFREARAAPHSATLIRTSVSTGSGVWSSVALWISHAG